MKGSKVSSSISEPISFNDGGETVAETTPDNSIGEITPEHLSQSSGGQTEAPKDNPAWAEYLQDIPDAFQPKIKEAFQKWDQGVNARFQTKAQEFQELQQKYAGFDPFIQQNVTPEQLQAAQVLIQELNKDPRAFYERLGEHFGLTAEQAQEAMEGDEDEAEEFDAETGQLIDPRVDELRRQQEALIQQQEAIQQYIQEQANLQIQQQADAALQNEIGEFQKKYNVPDVEMNEIIRTAAYEAQRNPNITIEQAAGIWNQRKAALFAQRPSNNAPGVVPANGANPITPRKGYGEMDKNEFESDTLQALKSIL